ncbi:hypothetical protein PILCRDRAFT_7176 [Piloderma croceum F 1598]|uniref:Tyrosinase copper-binding domain-containing protein n=1 Tax=Piloderma croceum (strain F 1598) TaxID=765440 RepID=A0A0C3FYC9_PILCF|nr:hypothetical protein PILCRDRAFT_7176 [Piloderma croceum F 1598]
MLLLLAELVIIAASLRIYPVTAAYCTEPVVRKEWRKLSIPEKSDWIRALNEAGDDALSPTVKPNDIVSVNVSGSYYPMVGFVHTELQDHSADRHVSEPLFFMHHAMVDKVWSDWHHRHSSNFWAYEGGSVQAIENSTE